MAKSSPEISLTFIKLDPASGKPLYRQLCQEIREAVLNGMLKHGDRMPATRVLAKDLHISRNSVVQAFDQLTLEGYLNSKIGAGTYICERMEGASGKTKRVKLVMPAKDGTLVKFNPSVNIPEHGKYVIKDCKFEEILPFQTTPDFEHFPFAVWSKVAAGIYRDITSLHLGYDHAQGYLPLREVLAGHLRINRSINCTAEQIVIVNGSRQALHLLMEMFLNKGDQCWMEDPGYSGAKSAISRFGGVICPVPVTEKGMDLDYAALHYPKARMAYVTPSHQFPLGITMPLMERVKLLQHAEKTGMLIIEDDYDSEFRYNGRPVPALKGLDKRGHVLYAGTFSKVLFPALRIGYVVMPTAEMAQQLSFIKAITDRQNPVIDQAILCEFIRQGHFARHLRRMRTLYKKNQDDLVNLLQQHLKDDIKIHLGDAGMHFIIEFLQDKHAETLKKQCIAGKLVLLPVADLSIQFKFENSFLMGFTGFSYERMEQAVLLLKKILSGNS